METSIAAIVNYCTQDYRFLSLCLNEIKKFTSHILIPVCTHFFDGSQENQPLLLQSYAEHLDCHFLEFAYDEKNTYGLYQKILADDPNWAHYWHSTARYVAFHFVPKEVKYVLFIDVDEIFEGERFLKWLSTGHYKKYDALRLSSYFYFRSPSYRMKRHTLNAVLVKRDKIEPEKTLLSILERKAIYEEIEGKKIKCVTDEKGIPFVHHYSWVRTKEELFQKVQRWGHKNEDDYESKLKQEFLKDFRGVDCVFKESYEKVEPLHDLLGSKITIDQEKITKISLSHVTKVDREIIFHKSIENLLL